MSNEHAHEQHGEEKKHGDIMESALKDAERHQQGGADVDPVPPADKGGHSHSAAAHLKSNDHLHNNALQGGHSHVPMTQVNAQKQPPQEQSRSGKQHRG